MLGLLFIGLALGIVALVLLFSTLRPPIAIQGVEWVQAVVAVIAIGLGFWLL